MSDTPSSSRCIRVLTLNIHKGHSMTGRHDALLEQIRVNVREIKADLVCLQEVVGEYQNEVKQSQFEFLAEQIWHHYAYGKNAIRSRGHHGNAILSHFPFIRYENIDISNHRFERRGILHGVVSAPEWEGTRLHVMTLHLDLLSWGRRRQLKKLCELIDHRVPPHEPLVVCGDFNDWREEATTFLKTHAKLSEAHWAQMGEHAQTFPAYLPILRLDRIYVRGLNVKSITRLNSDNWQKLSDHLALFAELTF